MYKRIAIIGLILFFLISCDPLDSESLGSEKQAFTEVPQIEPMAPLLDDTLVIHWYEVPSAIKYEIQIRPLEGTFRTLAESDFIIADLPGRTEIQLLGTQEDKIIALIGGGLSSNTNYELRARAEDSDGEKSDFSQIISATTAKNIVDNSRAPILSLQTPVGGNADSQIKLTWTIADQPSGYQVLYWKSKAPEKKFLLKSITALEESFTLDALDYHTEYALRVRAAYDTQFGPWSNTPTKKTAKTRPQSRTDLDQLIEKALAKNGNNADLNGIDTSLIKDMANLFKDKPDFNGDISEWNTANTEDMSSMFEGASKFNGDLSKWDTRNVRNMGSMFKNAKAFNQDIGTWNTQRVADMNSMFLNADAFNQDIGDWDTSKVEDMNSMFQDAKVFNQDIGDWDTSKVANMSSMFLYAEAFNNGDAKGGSTKPLKWDTSSVVEMRLMFGKASSFNQDIGYKRENGKIYWSVHNVKDMNSMFLKANKFNNGGQPLDWDTPSLTDMGVMFRETENFDQDLNSWDVSKVIYMNSLFERASKFNNGGQPLEWDTSEVKNMRYMFAQAKEFNQNIGSWDTSNVTDMSGMFFLAETFNNGGSPDIGNWQTTRVTDMSQLFYSAKKFNQDIGNWDTSSVITMREMFFSASAFNNGDIGNNGAKPMPWNTAELTNTHSMFRNAKKFNQYIGGWNTSKLTFAGGMFYDTAIFNNGDIGNNGAKPMPWNTAEVASMNQMFYKAIAFNQYIGNWDTSKNFHMKEMFAEARVFNNGDIGDNGAKPMLWNTTNIVDMGSVFHDALVFNQYIGGWNTSNVINMGHMFYRATAFNNGDSGNNGAKPMPWNTAKVMTMRGVFRQAIAFNQYIGNWDTSGLLTMGSMFQDNTVFNNGDSGDNGAKPMLWNTAKITETTNMFLNAKAFNQNIGSWDVSKVTTISQMFNGANKFNNGGSPDIGKWNTSQIRNMAAVFTNAWAFNQNIGSWNVSKVTTMAYMFENTRAFNNGGSPDIRNWDTANVTNMTRMFSSDWRSNRHTYQGTFAQQQRDLGTKFNQNISKWNTFKVRLHSDMFEDADQFEVKNRPLLP